MLIMRLAYRVFIVMLCGSLFLPSVYVRFGAAADNNENVIDAQINIEFFSGTDLNVNVSMIVHKIQVFDTIYTSDNIQSIALSDLETMGAIKLRLRDLLTEQMDLSFMYANITALTKKPTYKNMVFYDDFSVNLSPNYFNLNDTVNIFDVVNGVLDMGATVAYDFNWYTRTGWNNSYTIVLPDSVILQYANTANVNVQQNMVTWEMKNWNSASSNISGQIKIKNKDPTFVDGDEDDIFLTFSIDTTLISSVSLEMKVGAKKISLNTYDFIPPFISELRTIPADGIRLFVNNGFISYDDVYQKTVQYVEQNIVSMIQISTFNQTIDSVFSWDPETTINCTTPYDVSHMDTNPPFTAVLKDSDVVFRICEIPARGFFGLINAGATASIDENDFNFGDKLDKIGYPYEVVLYLPNNISFAGKNVYRWNTTNPPEGAFSSDVAQSSYVEEKIDIFIDIDITKMDLNLLSSFTGNAELVTLAHVKQRENAYVLDLPNEFSLSEKINVSYLNSDAFRICVEELIFSQEQIDTFLFNKKIMFEQRIPQIIPQLVIQGAVDRNAFYQSLQWDGDISTMDGLAPIDISVYADKIYSTNLNISILPPRVSFSNLTFFFQKIDDYNITYRLLFPNGISVRPHILTNKTISQGKLNDGREYVELSFSADDSINSSQMICEILASPIYLIGLFLPCILTLFLLIVLVIIIYFIRKKTRGRGLRRSRPTKRHKEIVEDETDSDYEGEDYYIPPPPTSRR